MDKDIRIRRITAEDIDDVVKLEESSFSQPWRKADFEDLIDKPDRGCLVAELTKDPAVRADSGSIPSVGAKREAPGRIVGCVVYRDIVGDVDITNVQVDEAFRRRGIARALMEEAMEQARAAGGERFTLEVRASNTPAITLYGSLGFVSEGIRPGFYESPKEDAVIMWKYEARSNPLII